ncbi:MAG: DUF4157 domain-containing protein [Burkholderiales bacterium]|nr:DUF4157 domain-containing protein [Burkholderiales bacterium]
MLAVMENAPRAIAQRRFIEHIHSSPRMNAQRQYMAAIFHVPAQRRINDAQIAQGIFKPAQPATAPAQKQDNTGLPCHLKQGIERLSGLSLDGVKVHYNSDKPAQLNAHAYTRGADIHVAAGQEKHLPHEAWHVVQQAQGRVTPTLQTRGVTINDNADLEREADTMGAKALQMKHAIQPATTAAAQVSKSHRNPESAASTLTIIQPKWVIQLGKGKKTTRDYLDDYEDWESAQTDPYHEYLDEHSNTVLADYVYEWSQTLDEAYNNMEWLSQFPGALTGSMSVINQMGTRNFDLYCDLLDYGLTINEIGALAGFGSTLHAMAMGCSVAEMNTIASVVTDKLLQLRLSQKMGSGLQPITVYQLCQQGGFANCYRKVADAAIPGAAMDAAINTVTPRHYVNLLNVGTLTAQETNAATGFGLAAMPALAVISDAQVRTLCTKFNTPRKKQQIAQTLDIPTLNAYANGAIGAGKMGKLLFAANALEVTAAVAVLGQPFYAALLNDFSPTQIHGMRNCFGGATIQTYTETIYRLGPQFAFYHNLLANGGLPATTVHAVRGFSRAGINQLINLNGGEILAIGNVITNLYQQMRMAEKLTGGLGANTLHALSQTPNFANHIDWLIQPDCDGASVETGVGNLNAAAYVQLLNVAGISVQLTNDLSVFGVASVPTLAGQNVQTLGIINAKFNSDDKKNAILGLLTIGDICAYAAGHIGQGHMSKLLKAANGGNITNAVGTLGQEKYRHALVAMLPDNIAQCFNALNILQPVTIQQAMQGFVAGGLSSGQTANLTNRLLTGGHALDDGGFTGLMTNNLQYLINWKDKRDFIRKYSDQWQRHPGSIVTRSGEAQAGLETNNILTVQEKQALAKALITPAASKGRGALRNFVLGLNGVGHGSRMNYISILSKFGRDHLRDYQYREQNIAYHQDNVWHTVNCQVQINGNPAAVTVDVVDNRRNHIVSGHTFKYYNMQDNNIDRSNTSSMFNEGTGINEVSNLIDQHVPLAAAGMNFTQQPQNILSGNNIGIRRSGGRFYLTRFYLPQDNCTDQEITRIKPFMT